MALEKTTFEEMREEEMFVLVAPDGTPQLTTLAPDLETCIAISRLLEKAGFGISVGEMLQSGFKYLPVKISVSQNGEENVAFKNALIKSWVEKRSSGN